MKKTMPKTSSKNLKENLQIKVDFNVLRIKYVIFFLAAATGIAGGILSIYAYNKFIPHNNTLGINIAQIKDKPSAKEIAALVNKVSEIAILPKDEIPEIFNISDLTQLQANPFFADASVKDFMLIYKKAAKVYLYNPTLHKIVNIGPYYSDREATASASPILNPNEDEPSSPSADTITGPTKVVPDDSENLEEPVE